MRIIAIANQKGGCGKTTTAVNLAAALARQGKRVLIVDLDPQSHATLGLGHDPTKLEITIYHCLTHKDIPISEVVISTKIKGLDLAPSNVLLASVGLAPSIISEKEFALHERLKEISDEYDICILDCPPSLELLTLNALVSSTGIIVPVQAHYYALEGLKLLLETVKNTRRRFYPCPVKILGLLLTFVEDKAALNQQVAQQMRKFFGNLVFRTIIHSSIDLAEAPSAGQSILTYAPASKAATEYEALAQEVIETEPLEEKVPKDISTIVDRSQVPSGPEDQAISYAAAVTEAQETLKALAEAAPMEAEEKVRAYAKALSEVEEKLQAESEARSRAEQQAQAEAQRRSQAEAKAEEEAAAIAQAEEKLQAESEARARAEQEAQAEAQRRAEAEDRAKQEAEKRMMAEEKFLAEARTEVEAEAEEKARSYAEALTEAEERLKEEIEARTRAEEEARAEAQLRAEAEARAQAEAQARSQAEEKLRAEAEELTRLEAEAKAAVMAEAEERIRAEAAERARQEAEAEAARAEAEAARAKAKAAAMAEAEAEEAISTVEEQEGVPQPTGAPAFTSSTDAPETTEIPGPKILPTQEPVRFYHLKAFKIGSLSVIAALIAIVFIVFVVTTLNKAPVAKGDSLTTQEDTPVTITLVGSDKDVEDELTYNVVKGPSYGSLSGIAPNLTYTPMLDYNGSDSFTFTVNDGKTDSKPATVSIKITALNDDPVANPQPVITRTNKPASITLTGNDPDGDTLTFSIFAEPWHGKLVPDSNFNTTGKLTYTPDPSFVGPDSFTFKSIDGTVESAPAMVSIKITPNHPPVADLQSVTTTEDASIAINLKGSDPDGDEIIYSVVTEAFHGSLSGTVPNLTYTPQENFSGSDSFAFKVNDGTDESASATVSITVTSVNDPPIANSDSATTQEETPVSIALKGSDPEEDPLSYSIVEDPIHGSLSGDVPNLNYTPKKDYSGSDSFTFKANDGTADSDVATVSLTITPVDDPPIAIDDSVTTQEDVPVSIGLLSSDPDGDPLTYSIVTGPSHGSLSGTEPNITYTPQANFSGSDNFTYKINDGKTDSASATVSITVISVNDAPTANNDSVTVQEDTPTPITLVGSDPEGDPLTFSIVAGPSHGSLSGTEPNLTYTPDKDFDFSDRFTFKVNDGTTDSNDAIVSITITPIDDPPTAIDDNVTTQEETPVFITLSGSDPDGDQLTYSIVEGPSHGSLSGTEPNMTYTPEANFSGQDSLTFKVNDGVKDSVYATISINVTSVNDPPTANNKSVTVQEDTPTPITLVGSDPEEDPLTYIIVEGPSHGSLSGTGPNLTYSPDKDFDWSDRFTFKVNDGTIDSDAAVVSITITPANDPPIAQDGSVTTDEEKPVSITLTGIDPDKDPLTYTIIEDPSHGSLSGTEPNMIYTPETDFSGEDKLTFKVNDGMIDSVVATMSITVNSMNDLPIAKDDDAKTEEDVPVKIDVLANDTDIDNDPLKITNITQGKQGLVTIENDRMLTYAPKVDFSGTDMFTYIISDGKGGIDTATVNVTVVPGNDAPIITSTPVTVAMDGVPYIYDVNATDPDAEDTLNYSLTKKPAGMTIDPATGLIKWKPSETQAGNNEVVVTVVDSGLIPASQNQSFTINVKPAPPRKATLTIADGYDHRSKQTLSTIGNIGVVQASDNKRMECQFGSYISYDFSKVSVPAGAVITSVVVYVEHFEDQQFPATKLQWSVGKGWPDNPEVWISINAPVRAGERNEALDSWDVTSFVNTLEKINSLQLQIKNDDNIARRKTSIDYIYAEIKWDWPAQTKPAQNGLEIIR